jgi:DNA end-binding protein Ku
VQLAVQIIDALRAGWDPRRYKDSYTNQVKKLIERQAAGKHITVERAPAEQAQVVDLMAALEASLKATGTAGTAGKSRTAKPRDMEKASSEAADESGDSRGSGRSGSTRAKKASTRGSPARKSA